MERALHRRFRLPRLLRRIPVQISDEKGMFAQAFSLNVSLLGCAIATESPCDVGARLGLTFILPSGVLARAQGVVCWSRNSGSGGGHPTNAGPFNLSARSGVWLISAEESFRDFVRDELGEKNDHLHAGANGRAEFAARALAAATVLVVEDDADLRFTLSDMIAERGYCVRSAINGREALATLAQTGPRTVIVLDLTMPVMSGWEFLEHLHERSERVPVIIVSAAGGELPKATHVFKKPVDFESLIQRVAECCGTVCDATPV